MKCPFCKEEMKHGLMYGDGRSRVRWKEGIKKAPFLENFSRNGCLSSVKYSPGRFKTEADYCPVCRKMIIDTYVEN